ncbi:MAG: CAP domain-containing protein [Planctomycetes bacterium]|nr:CAP domain-containing protein [Planctomycetota bacterium]
MKRTLLAAALVAALGLLARADVIYLNAGGVIKGTILEDTDRGLVIRTEDGVVTEVAHEEVSRVERGESAEAIYRERLGALATGDAEGHYRLALWCREVHLEDEAREEMAKVLVLDPEHVDARAALGYVRRGGEWLLPGEELAPSADAGLGADRRFYDHRLIEGLPEGVRAAAGRLLEADPAARAEAYAFLAQVQEVVPAGRAEEARHAVREFVAWRERGLARDVDRAYRRVEALAPVHERARVREAKARWLARWTETRDEALRVIFDKAIYPDEDHGRVGQPIVDDRVKAVREAWEFLDVLLERDLAPMGTVEPELAARRHAELVAMEAGLAESRAFLQTAGMADLEPPPAGLSPLARGLLAWRGGLVAVARPLADLSTGYERLLHERARLHRVRAFNAGVTPGGRGIAPTAVEVMQVAITNDYRHMMGREPLEIDPRLIAAARGHSQEMTRLGYFAHESPVPERREPSMRAALEGYPSGVSENISQGSPTPDGTFWAWYHSAPHHRNMLDAAHRSMGAGLDGELWTQDFGSEQALER